LRVLRVVCVRRVRVRPRGWRWRPLRVCVVPVVVWRCPDGRGRPCVARMRVLRGVAMVRRRLVVV
jgi:hypothetical protein